MQRPPPSFTQTDPLLPDTPLFRSHYAVTCRVPYPVAEDRRTARTLVGPLHERRQAMAVVNVVSEDQASRGAPQELLTNDECLCEPVRTGLYCIAETHAPDRKSTRLNSSH